MTLQITTLAAVEIFLGNVFIVGFGYSEIIDMVFITAMGLIIFLLMSFFLLLQSLKYIKYNLSLLCDDCGLILVPGFLPNAKEKILIEENKCPRCDKIDAFKISEDKED